MSNRKMIYNPATGHSEPSYSCAMCCDRQVLSVPLRGEKWYQDSLYIEGDAVSIVCPFCLSPSAVDAIYAAHRSLPGYHGGREVEIDWDYLKILEAARKGEITFAERERRAIQIRDEQARVLQAMQERAKQSVYMPDAEVEEKR